MKWTLILSIAAFIQLGTLTVAHAATELVRINNSVITLEDFNKKYHENARFFSLNPPSKKGVLDDLIKRELGVQEAKKMGLDKDPEVIERMNTVLYNTLLEKKLGKDFESIHISDEQASTYYSQNPEIRTSHIFVAVAPNANAADQKKAYDKLKKIQDEHIVGGKMTFSEVAQRFSEGPAAAVGGDIDYQSRDHLDPTYYNTALKLGSIGRISGIVRSQFGYHIIKLTAIRPWEEANSIQVKRVVFEVERAKVFEKYMGSLRNQARVAVKSELIKD